MTVAEIAYIVLRAVPAVKRIYQESKHYSPAMKRRYYALLYRLNARDRYLLWITNDVDGVVVDCNGQVPSFNDPGELQTYAASQQFTLEDETPILHDLDNTAEWIETGTAATVECDKLLAAWNLFADISKSVAGNFDNDTAKTDELYQRLFYGTNTANEVLRPKDEPVFRPQFSKADVRVIRETLNQGLALFKRVVHPLHA